MIILINFILLHINIKLIIHIQYVDSVGGGKYAFRVYVSESSGAILGANFMKEMNVIFDEGKYFNSSFVSFLLFVALLCFPLSLSSPHLRSSLT